MPFSHGIAPPSFRLPDKTRVGRVRLQVSDLQRSIDYYTRVLGLEVRGQSAAAATLAASGASPVLIELNERRGAGRVPSRGAYGLYHFAILLPDRADLGGFVSHLAGLGLRFGAADHWVSEALYLTDPDGLGIEVYADRPREAWETRGREVAMATEPLDLDGLVTAAAGRAWTAAPDGTVIGHVHLHVGSLQEAEAFYHAALGLDKTAWSYPGALFLSAGGYHHHLGTNTWSPGPSATEAQARLLDWELQLPTADDAGRAAASLREAGYAVEAAADGWTAADPWNTRVRITATAS